MDWTSRMPVQWNWETLGFFNGEEAELSKPSKDPKSNGIAVVTDYAYSMGMPVCSSSEVGDCSLRGSNSASVDSSKAKKRIPEINNRSVCEKSTLSTYCQVEGCNIDLAIAKDYHRKHRVCEDHAKSPKVIVGGQDCRFCQQCSRFHALSEFDQKKRSCRKRLFYHNARRRKPQLGMTSFSSPTLSASLYGLEPNIAFRSDGAPDVRSACSLLSTESHTPPNRGISSDIAHIQRNKGPSNNTTIPVPVVKEILWHGFPLK